jgi:hypothetical protein
MERVTAFNTKSEGFEGVGRVRSIRKNLSNIVESYGQASSCDNHEEPPVIPPVEMDYSKKISVLKKIFMDDRFTDADKLMIALGVVFPGELVTNVMCSAIMKNEDWYNRLSKKDRMKIKNLAEREITAEAIKEARKQAPDPRVNQIRNILTERPVDKKMVALITDVLFAG